MRTGAGKHVAGERRKRTLHCQVLVETDMDDEELTEELMKVAHALTQRVEGRLTVTAAEVDPEIWKKIGLSEKAKPDATVIWRPK